MKRRRQSLPAATAVESLVVREMKGIGSTFTPNMALQLTFLGLVYKPEGEFDATYHLLAGPLLTDMRLAGRAKHLTFVPAFSWPTHELVIAPFKRTRMGNRVLEDLQTLTPLFPNYKTFVEWSDAKRRHIVRQIQLTEQERETIASLQWPTPDQVIDALQIVAFDDIGDLAAANDEVRLLLTAKEVV